MDKEGATKQIAALRAEARHLATIEENIADELTRLLKARKGLLTAATKLEEAIGEEPPPPPPPPPEGDVLAEIPGRLWSLDHRSGIELTLGKVGAVMDAYTGVPIVGRPTPDGSPSTIGYDAPELAGEGERRAFHGGWLVGPPAAGSRTLIIVVQWTEQPRGHVKLIGADASSSERGGFALGATPSGRTEAWADDGRAFAAIRAPLTTGRPILHVLRIHEQSIEMYVDGHEREVGYGQPIVPFSGPIVLLAGWWQHQVVDQADAMLYAAHAYDRAISDGELAKVVDYFRELAPPGDGDVVEPPPPPPPPPPDTDADITVTVAAEPDHTFRAGGFSVQRENVGNPWVQGKATPAFEKAAFSDLGTNIVRWWYIYNDQEFINSYVTSGAMKAARAGGAKYFLLGPTPFNSHGSKPNTPSSWYTGETATRRGLEEASARVAGLIAKVRDQYGFEINATGLMNEPGSAFRINIKKSDWDYHIEMMRDALDRRGLEEVEIIGYEWQPPRQNAKEYARYMADQATGRKLVGISSHSYGITIDDELARLARDNDWQYWMTEGGEARSGADIAARFLSDVNHRCTHWVFFLGPNTSANPNTLLAPPNKTTPQYHALRALWQVFVPGTIMHLCTSSAEGQMHWFRGDKRINVAAGVRPDGRWAVGVVNNTGGRNDEFRKYPPSESIVVGVVLPSIGSGLVFDVEEADSTSIENLGAVTSENDVLFLPTEPSSVYTLLSRTTP